MLAGSPPLMLWKAGEVTDPLLLQVANVSHGLASGEPIPFAVSLPEALTTQEAPPRTQHTADGWHRHSGGRGRPGLREQVMA